jgi:hypothetical protein
MHKCRNGVNRQSSNHSFPRLIHVALALVILYGRPLGGRGSTNRLVGVQLRLRR